MPHDIMVSIFTRTDTGGANENRGIIPRASEEIFNYIETRSDAKSKFLVRASFLQVHISTSPCFHDSWWS